MNGRLDLDAQELRRLALRAVDLVVDHLGGIRERDVYRPMTPAERHELLAAPLPEDGESPETILDRVHASVLTHPMGNGHPRFFGWVNSPPAPLGVLADFLAAALDPSCAGGELTQPKKRGCPLPIGWGRTASRTRSRMASGARPSTGRRCSRSSRRSSAVIGVKTTPFGTPLK